MAEAFLEWVADSCMLRTALARARNDDYFDIELVVLDTITIDAPSPNDGDREPLVIDNPEGRRRLVDLWLGVAEERP